MSENKAIATSFTKGGASPRGGRKPKEITDALNNHAINGLDLLWKVASDPDHEWHKQWGFKALQELVRAAAPKRKEMSGPEGGPLELSLANMFYGNSLENHSDEVIEIESQHEEAEDVEVLELESKEGLDVGTGATDCEEIESVPRSSGGVH